MRLPLTLLYYIYIFVFLFCYLARGRGNGVEIRLPDARVSWWCFSPETLLWLGERGGVVKTGSPQSGNLKEDKEQQLRKEQIERYKFMNEAVRTNGIPIKILWLNEVLVPEGHALVRVKGGTIRERGHH